MDMPGQTSYEPPGNEPGGIVGDQTQRQNGKDPKVSTEAGIRECVSRLRRLETRFTNYMIQQGFETEAQRPVLDEALQRIVLPSLHCSVKELLGCLPDGHVGPVELLIGDRKIATFAIRE